MTKKLYVPDRILAQKAVNPTPKAISKAFDQKEEAVENSKDPSKLDVSVLERLPRSQPQPRCRMSCLSARPLC